MPNPNRLSAGPRIELGDGETTQPIANFRGSFVVDHLGDLPASATGHPKRKSGLQRGIAYFRGGWNDAGLWKSAFVELVATGLLCYLSGLIDVTVAGFGTLQAAGYIGISNVFLLTLFIMAAGPGSGGHVNPTITFATMVTGLTSFPRGILYLVGQLVGAALAGGVLRGFLGHDRSKEFQGGGCFRNPNSVTQGQAFLVETVSSFALIFLAFGVGLDPRQQKLFGMFIGPLAVGCAVGLTSFASAGIFPGYTGASMHPARCFAFAVSRGDFSDQWIWWLGPVVGALLYNIVFRIAPPYHSAPIPQESRAIE